MKLGIAAKLFILAVLVGLFMIPLVVIWGIVAERARYRDRVVAEVGKTSARAQILFGPILILDAVPQAEIAGSATGGEASSRVLRTPLEAEKVVLPETLSVRSDVRVETRQKGIYRVPVFRATNRVRAHFAVPATATGGAATPRRARIVFGVSDARGLRVIPAIQSNGGALTVRPLTDLTWVPQGFSAEVELSQSASTLAVEAEIALTGTDRLGLVPLGASTDVRMESNWPHPGFGGGFGPDERSITRRGFEAAWQVSRFATGIPAAIASRTATGSYEGQGNEFGVRFVQPVDIYQQSERAVKYGVLFVALTFVAFFLFETLRRQSIHPIQYVLVAAPLAVFFLLLVSLSEHLPFATAYLVASGACVGLLMFYAGHVLGSVPRALGFGAFLVALYVLLYVILLSEDYALLLGSLLLFAALSVVLITTRRVDWYRLGDDAGPR